MPPTQPTSPVAPGPSASARSPGRGYGAVAASEPAVKSVLPLAVPLALILVGCPKELDCPEPQVVPPAGRGYATALANPTRRSPGSATPRALTSRRACSLSSPAGRQLQRRRSVTAASSVRSVSTMR